VRLLKLLTLSIFSVQKSLLLIQQQN